MRVVVTGATGNVGTSTVRALAADPGIDSVLGLSRRPAELKIDKTEWAEADVARHDLAAHFRGADAVVHLAWLFQPTHRPRVTWDNNVIGSARVFRAVAEAGVPALVYASSVGAYSPVPSLADKEHPRDESWPTHGWPEAAYGREKAYVERLLDSFQADHPDVRVVRLRPGFVFKREAASEQRRLFAGPLLPGRLVRPGMVPVVPDIPGLAFQALHTEDMAQAYRLAVTRDVRGPFNIAAEPVIDAAVLAEVLRARRVPVPAVGARAAVAAAWRLNLVPASPHLVDMVLRLPIMDVTRAREELGWNPEHTGVDALRELLEGLREGAGMDTPPLARETGGPMRLREMLTGVGRRP
ncbi:SDR family oxidoreductase [Actinomadura kijaniata]|uniref:Nucleoside-diphosphate-sugar epimerase n=1 Tax=Actinomadura namibiensis TaxID=182080 RepID=A0A7W3QRY8_ACTNM|nr:NAD-dependent epimerase/dehydratase family protein [Actinomadura namibiensis]MBA8957269.1 nucleoside-diphosphate-sugar epimerase [Actinomadura namibiensis]